MKKQFIFVALALSVLLFGCTYLPPSNQPSQIPAASIAPSATPSPEGYSLQTTTTSAEENFAEEQLVEPSQEEQTVFPSVSVQEPDAESAELEIADALGKLSSEIPYSSTFETLRVEYFFTVRNTGKSMDAPTVEAVLKDPAGETIYTIGGKRSLKKTYPGLDYKKAWEGSDLFIVSRITKSSEASLVEAPFKEGEYVIEAKLYASDDFDAKLLATTAKKITITKS